MMPVLIMTFGCLGILVCGIVLWRARERPARPPAIPKTELNKDIDLDLYQPTEQESVFVEKALASHPFKVRKNGIFCGVCLITTQFGHSADPVTTFSHACTVIRKDWKVLICRDDWNTEYYVSIDRAHFRKR